MSAMSADLSESWLASAGRTAMRDTLIVAGLMSFTAGAIALSLTFLTGAPAIPALTFIARALTAIGGFFLALPLFLGATSDDRWTGGVRITGLVIGFLVVLFTLIRI